MSLLGNATAGDPTAGFDPNGGSGQAVNPALSTTGGIVPAAQQAADYVQQTPAQPVTQNTTPSQAAPAQGGSRLARIIQAVAGVASTALAGIPNQGRPSFVTGLGEGARAEKENIANQQAIKFKNFDDQVRLAQLHNQDVALQNATQAQLDAHNAAELNMRKQANDLGVDYDTIANHGPAVVDHLTASTATNGAASVPPGTHVSGDGNTVYIPQNTQKTRDAQKHMYNELSPALGLPALPEGAQFVPDKNTNFLTNKMLGYGLDGNPINHDALPGVLAAERAQRESLAKNGATPNQLKALDNVIALHQASLKALDEHAAGVKQQSKQAELDAENSPQSIAGAAKKAGAIANAELPTKLALQKAAAQNKNDSTELNAVAFDPTYKNADGTLGANVVMSKADASAKGLQHYKANPDTINTVVAGMNDVQNKLNQLADVVTNPQRMGQVQAGLAAALLAHGKGLQLDFHGVGLDTSRVNEISYANDLKLANQATKDYVTAMVGAHEAITQLPRLQTFGKSNRMTEKQMEAAVNLLPQPGDGDMASQKMSSLQGMIDPLRKQIPHMPGAESTPSWMEKRQQQRQTPPSGGGSSNLGRAVMGNVNDYINSFQPTK